MICLCFVFGSICFEHCAPDVVCAENFEIENKITSTLHSFRIQLISFDTLAMYIIFYSVLFHAIGALSTLSKTSNSTEMSQNYVARQLRFSSSAHRFSSFMNLYMIFFSFAALCRQCMLGCE